MDRIEVEVLEMVPGWSVEVRRGDRKMIVRDYPRELDAVVFAIELAEALGAWLVPDDDVFPQRVGKRGERSLPVEQMPDGRWATPLRPGMEVHAAIADAEERIANR